MMDMPAKEYLFGSIFLLSNKLQALGDSYLDEITVKQWLLLMTIKTLSKEQPTVTEVASFMGGTRQNVRKMLEVLSIKGFVSIHQNELDKRNLSVALTPKTYRFFAQFDTKGDIFLSKLFDDMSPELLESGRQLFERLFESIERMEQDHV